MLSPMPTKIMTPEQQMTGAAIARVMEILMEHAPEAGVPAALNAILDFSLEMSDAAGGEPLPKSINVANAVIIAVVHLMRQTSPDLMAVKKRLRKVCGDENGEIDMLIRAAQNVIFAAGLGPAPVLH